MEGYTLFMRKSIHDASCNCPNHLPEGSPKAAHSHSPTRSQSRSQMPRITIRFNKSSNSHPNGNNQTRSPMDRCAHASSFVRITHSLQRVVCTLSLGSKSRTTGLGSARQNRSPQSRWPSIHASLTFHIRFSLSSSAASYPSPIISESIIYLRG